MDEWTIAEWLVCLGKSSMCLWGLGASARSILFKLKQDAEVAFALRDAVTVKAF